MFLFYDHAGGTGNWNKHKFVFSDERITGVCRQSRSDYGKKERLSTEECCHIYRTDCGLDGRPRLSIKQRDKLSLRHPKTGLWLLQSDEFKKLKTIRSLSLFCPGVTGVGKTVMTSVIIDDLNKLAYSSNTVALACAYCEFGSQEVQNAERLLGSLLKQLLRACYNPPEEASSMFNKLKHIRQPNLEDISRAIQSIARMYPKVFIVIEALDECNKRERKKLVGELFKLQKESDVAIFATSRFDLEIQEEFGDALHLEIHDNNKDMGADISLYIGEIIDFVAPFIQSAKLITKKCIKEKICDASDGIFLLAHLYLDLLEDRKKARDTITALECFNAAHEDWKDWNEIDLVEAVRASYSKTLQRIDDRQSGFRKDAKTIFTWVIFTETRVTSRELKTALAITIGPSALERREDKLYTVQEIVNHDLGLVISEGEGEDNTVRFVHRTAKGFFETHLCGIKTEKEAPFYAGDKQMIAQSEQEAHKQLTLACVIYLSSDEFNLRFCLIMTLHVISRNSLVASRNARNKYTLKRLLAIINFPNL
ncbi:hypothetical protein OCU04_008965 [Sclerotinia nivalis]|uniref:Nephrocystin 3-like N-terminal domain-containing protein n=1 Tax=Sclerotinia nivalis TaxID=352851 RepID=A0A9X0AGW0_9HELO|nr:hypothetical protein OCU04_008965 [Sclerotinia nivalis]